MLTCIHFFGRERKRVGLPSTVRATPRASGLTFRGSRRTRPFCATRPGARSIPPCAIRNIDSKPPSRQIGVHRQLGKKTLPSTCAPPSATAARLASCSPSRRIPRRSRPSDGRPAARPSASTPARKSPRSSATPPPGSGPKRRSSSAKRGPWRISRRPRACANADFEPPSSRRSTVS